MSIKNRGCQTTIHLRLRDGTDKRGNIAHHTHQNELQLAAQFDLNRKLSAINK